MVVLGGDYIFLGREVGVYCFCLFVFWRWGWLVFYIWVDFFVWEGVGVELEGGFRFFGVELVFVGLVEGGFGLGVECLWGLCVVGYVWVRVCSNGRNVLEEDWRFLEVVLVGVREILRRERLFFSWGDSGYYFSYWSYEECLLGGNGVGVGEELVVLD